MSLSFESPCRFYFFVRRRRVSALVKTLPGMSSAIWQTQHVGFIAKTFCSGYRAQFGRRRVSALIITIARVSSAIRQTPCVGFGQNSCSSIERNLADAVCRLWLKLLLRYRAQLVRRRVSALVQ